MDLVSPPQLHTPAARRQRLAALRAPHAEDTDRLAERLQAACRPAHLGAPAARALAALARRRRFGVGEAVLRQGEHTDALWLVDEGRVSVGSHDAAQRWRPTRTVDGAQWLDVASAWLDAPLAETALVEADAQLCAFARADVEALCHTHAGVARVLLTLLAARVHRLTQEQQGLLAKDVLARCADWLLSAPRSTDDGSTVTITQRKRSLASQLGATPETLSRTLRQLCELGAIEVDGYRVRLRDEAALRRLAIDGARRPATPPG